MKTILVVDDNQLNHKAAGMVLQNEYRVIAAMSGEQALTYLESGECDIILLDINMPKMDGFEVLEKIREMEKWRNIPVLFLMEGNDAETETLCFKKGAVDCIEKPFVPEVMLARIGRILELEELRHNLTRRLEEKNREVTDMRNKSNQDALTGLWNRLYTEDVVNQLLDSGCSGALLMIDIDNFKAVNDNYGHIAGDNLLKVFADILRECSAPEDVLCRVGGDEFMVFVKDVTLKSELSNRATDILSALRRKIDEFGYGGNTSASIGIAQPPMDGTRFIELYNCADKALYYVKQNGKNSHHFFGDRLKAANKRGERTVDLRYLRELMNRADSGKGAYQMDFESFHHVYNFIRRFIERSHRNVQTVLFTVSENRGTMFDESEVEFALELLEKAIYTSLRRSDVSTRYSSKQLIVILMEANSENGDMVAERIIENFHKLYTRGKIRIDYGIARMEGSEENLAK